MIQEVPVGYSIELFRNQAAVANFDCLICLNIRKNPVLCVKGHGYCRSCIEEWKESGKEDANKCPECKELLDTLVPNRDAGRTIDESLVYCYTRLPGLLAGGAGDAAAADATEDVTDEEEQPATSSSSSSSSAAGQKRKNGTTAVAAKKAKARVDHCTWTGMLQDAAGHFHECDYAGVVCSFEGCDVVVARKDKAGHEAACDHGTMACKWRGCDMRMMIGELDQHQAVCPKRSVTCPNAGCGFLIPFENLAVHKACYCQHEEVPCPFASVGCTARVKRKDVDSHEDSAMKQHNRLLLRNASEQQQLIESLKHHVMPVDEIIVFHVKHDELTGKVPFVPRFPIAPKRLYSENRVVRGYPTSLYVQTNDARPEFKDHYGVCLCVQGGKVQYTFELVHHDGQRASAIKCSGECTYTADLCAKGYPTFISKARLASPDNNPYVKEGYVTFKCTFKFV